MKSFIKVFLFLLLVSHLSLAQNSDTQDPLLQKSYEELSKEYDKPELDTLKATVMTRAYLQKAKNEKDTLHIADGYYRFAFLTFKTPLAIAYLDSAITVSKHLKNEDYPAKAYLSKGLYFYNKRDFIKAIDLYAYAYDEARQTNNPSVLNDVKFYIGTLKIRLGDYKEALLVFKSCAAYYLKEEKIERYLTALVFLSEANLQLKNYEECSLINQKVYTVAIKNNYLSHKHFTIFQEGIVSYYLKNYEESVHTIEKTIPYFTSVNENSNVAIAYYYLGMNYYAMGHEALAIDCFKKVDAVFKKTNDLYPETRQSYEMLITYYKAIGDTTNQLYYIEQLLQLDKVLDTNYKYLSRKINNAYDTPRLLLAKQTIITDLSKKQRSSYIKIVVLVVLLLFLLFLCLYYYRKQKRYRINFEKLMQDKTKNPAIANTIQKQITESSLDIQEHVVHEILDKLSVFEAELGFLNNDCTLTKVAKDTQTNANYLSKIINIKKQTSFTGYINDLRIDYAVDQLKTDKKFRNYSIQGMAETVGFNAAQAFSKAFYNKTGIKPSYFINELKNQGL
jgi:AraC-like DNA-binding protein